MLCAGSCGPKQAVQPSLPCTLKVLKVLRVCLLLRRETDVFFARIMFTASRPNWDLRLNKGQHAKRRSGHFC